MRKVSMHQATIGSTTDNKNTVHKRLMLLSALICTSLAITGCHSDESYYGKAATPEDSAGEPQVQPLPEPQPDPDINSKPEGYTDGLNVLAYNVYLMNRLISKWQQDLRAEHIVNSASIKGHDVVILNELFDDKSSKTLLDGLKAEYPHQTPILGRTYSEEEIANGDAGTNPEWQQSLGNISKQAFEDGGVAIISRWPIKEQIQHVYTNDGCGTDAYGKKGFVYALLDKNGQDYHVIGTHVQSQDSDCDAGQAEAVRKSQFTEITQFVTAKDIPVDDILFIGGDFNVIKDTTEYPDMLATLKVEAPDVYAGFATSWDPESNGIAGKNYPTAPREYLDYVFVSSRHAQPSYWHNQALDETSPRWQNDNLFYDELSDHYPIAAFAYADENTRSKSYRFVNRPYQQVKLRNASGDYVMAKVNGKEIGAGSLVMAAIDDSMADNVASSFTMDNWYPRNQAYCIRNNDYIQLKSNQETAGYWNIEDQNDGKYRLLDNSSENLRVQIIDDDGDCLKNGDQIVLADKDKTTEQDGYLYQLTADNTKGLALTFDGSDAAMKLTIEMPEGQLDDWADKLKYKP